ncbi:MAG: hypothetical protein LUK37_14150 [Clostridia bacterium]|nr:hypothetical protein [Clostridia bacterium]
MALELIKAFAKKNISDITDPIEKAEKEAILSQVMDKALKDMASGEPATIVVRQHFISIYWYDHIRSENLQEELKKYAHMSGVPAMGVGIYDDTNFSIYAVCNIGEPNARGFKGDYLFDFNDITPVAAEDICDTVDAPFLLDALQETLSKDEGGLMAHTFEQRTGLPILMFDEDCKEKCLQTLYQWSNATVYCEE